MNSVFIPNRALIACYCFKVKICCSLADFNEVGLVYSSSYEHTIKTTSHMKQSPTMVPIKLPLCVYSSTPPQQSWARWPALGLWWRGPGCSSVGRGGAGRSGHSRGSRCDGCARRPGRWSGWARSSPSSRPLGGCSLLIPHITCRGRHCIQWKGDMRKSMDVSCKDKHKAAQNLFTFFPWIHFRSQNFITCLSETNQRRQFLSGEGWGGK